MEEGGCEALGSLCPGELTHGGPYKPCSTCVIHSANMSSVQTVPSTGDASVNKAENNACPCGAFIQVGRDK